MVHDYKVENGAQLIINAIVGFESKSQLKFKVLSNLFGFLPRESHSRLGVYKAMLKVAQKDQELDVIIPTFKNLDEWLNDLKTTPKERSELYLSISESGIEENQSLQYLIRSLELVPNAASAKKAIKMTLNIPSIVLFENVFHLEAVKGLKGEVLYELLEIFLNKTLADYKSFIKKHPKFLQENGLDSERLLLKIRLLTLDSIASKNIGKPVKYDTISKELDIPVEKVEFWVIDGTVCFM
jgi:hypothetical protein